ncbi:MAG: hypothetical protein HOD63_14045 [Bacteroidetes bacterium]|jgi:hypothetical protein|nr:hypothetical protein [Bacteroidota bacterium]MBT5528171.1 hypothetical protein [Cytophagia bacterium]MBT3424865.1 hypothetical protein [Bacteroidota bacterium]MBT3802338.1 hypothetical protein [Bacteroidota bacterium]MBT3935535.1 hypothetical protein [Bacteroidota bacterium]
MQEGKITIKFFLNKRLPSKSIVRDERGQVIDEIVKYPIYIQLTFLRKSTQFKSSINTEYSDSNYSEDDNALMMLEKMYIIKVIEYENITNKAFSLKGFKSRYDIYSEQIFSLLEQKAIKTFLGALNNSESNYTKLFFHVDFDKIPFDIILSAALELIPDFQDSFGENKIYIDTFELFYQEFTKKGDVLPVPYPRLIDWLEGEGNINFDTINKIFKKNPECINTLSEIIMSRVEYI